MAKWIDGRRLRRGALLPLACLLLALGAVALAAGCGGASRDRAVASRRVVPIQHAARDRWTYARERFRETCSGCHTLADADAHGKRFNLDRDIKIDEARARYAIEHGEPGMPAWSGVLSRREFEELVAYVSTVQDRSKVGGETNWGWQLALRGEGEKWTPEDGSSSLGPPPPTGEAIGYPEPRTSAQSR